MENIKLGECQAHAPAVAGVRKDTMRRNWSEISTHWKKVVMMISLMRYNDHLFRYLSTWRRLCRIYKQEGFRHDDKSKCEDLIIVNHLWHQREEGARSSIYKKQWEIRLQSHSFSNWLPEEFKLCLLPSCSLDTKCYYNLMVILVSKLLQCLRPTHPPRLQTTTQLY